MKLLSVSNIDPNDIASFLLSASDYPALAVLAASLAGAEKSAKGRRKPLVRFSPLDNSTVRVRRSSGLPGQHADRHHQWPQAEADRGTVPVE